MSDQHDWDVLAERANSVRFPKTPTRDEVAPDEVADWEDFQRRFDQVVVSKRNHKYRHRIAAGFFGLMASPPTSAALAFSGRKIHEQQGKPGTFTATDHEFIDLVLSFDSGHWGLLANHVPFGVASGIPVSTVRALRDGRESELSADDQQVIAFIRAARDGTIDDDMWVTMVERLGSERGAVELVFFVMVLLTHVRLGQAFGEPEIEPAELDDLLDLLEAGKFELPDVVHAGPESTRPVPAHPRVE